MHGKSESVNPGLQITNSHAADGEVPTEPQRIVTVRMPKSLHESLRADAHAAKKSMNQLCVDRLLRLPDLSPEEA